jgi:hypothetical protein
MGCGMAGVQRKGTATCGAYAGARLVGRRGAGSAALRPVGARHVAPGKRVGKAVPQHMDQPRHAGPGEPRRGDMRCRRGRALER